MSKYLENGTRIKCLFKDNVWYKGSIIFVNSYTNGKWIRNGDVHIKTPTKVAKPGLITGNIFIRYDDGDLEGLNWPDKNVVLLKEKAENMRGRNEIQNRKYCPPSGYLDDGYWASPAKKPFVGTMVGGANPREEEEEEIDESSSSASEEEIVNKPVKKAKVSVCKAKSTTNKSRVPASPSRNGGPKSPSSKWACKVCTLENNSLAKKCQVCETFKKGEAKKVGDESRDNGSSSSSKKEKEVVVNKKTVEKDIFSDSDDDDVIDEDDSPPMKSPSKNGSIRK